MSEDAEESRYHRVTRKTGVMIYLTAEEMALLVKAAGYCEPPLRAKEAFARAAILAAARALEGGDGDGEKE